MGPTAGRFSFEARTLVKVESKRVFIIASLRGNAAPATSFLRRHADDERARPEKSRKWNVLKTFAISVRFKGVMKFNCRVIVF